jgi:cytochrome c oxidase assembly protein subunit 15
VVFLLIGLSVGLWFALRAVKAPQAAIHAAGMLIVIELAQGLIGFIQYFTNLPVLLVGAHMLGACLVWLGTLSVLWNIRERPHHQPSQQTNLTPSDAPATAPEPTPVA